MRGGGYALRKVPREGKNGEEKTQSDNGSSCCGDAAAFGMRKVEPRRRRV